MTFLDWIRAVFAGSELPRESVKRATATQQQSPVPDERPVPAGRTSVNDTASMAGTNWVVVEPEDPEGFWRLRNLDVATLDTSTPKELLDLLADLSPEVSRAIWDFLRMCNPGYTLRAYTLGDEKAIDENAKMHLDDLIFRMREKHGSFDVVLNRLFMGAFMRGAFCAELVLDGGASETLEIATPDPYSIRFRKISDALLKERWEPGQFQGRDFVSLDIPTFRYIPVDPHTASPYGRSLASPALFTAIFMLSLLHDVKRVIMQQGYKRLDISMSQEAAMDGYSFDAQGYASFIEYVQGAIAAVRSAYAALEPDDAFIHSDIFTLGTPAGTADSDAIGAIAILIEKLETSVARALKSNSLIMGTGDVSNSETNSNRNWEVYVAGIKSLQHLCENMLESLFALSLQAKGIQAKVEFRFAELRASEMFRDQQTLTLQIQNARAAYEAGFIDQNEASNMAVGHDAFAPEPITQQGEVELLENNNAGEEALNQGSDDRGVAIAPKPDIIFTNNGARLVTTNGNGVHSK